MYIYCVLRTCIYVCKVILKLPPRALLARACAWARLPKDESSLVSSAALTLPALCDARGEERAEKLTYVKVGC